MSSPKSAFVKVGDSVSFSCVVPNRTISHWYVNNKSVGHALGSGNFVMWTGCKESPKYCGGTLFIKHATMDLNGSNISCQVLHETCGDKNVSLSKSAMLIGEYYYFLFTNL